MTSWAQDISVEEINTVNDSSALDQQSKFFDHFYLGGGLSAQFGNYTLINVSPLIGYKIIDRWSVGVRGNYSYVNIRDFAYRYEDHIVGGSAFTRVFVFRNLFLHSEYEVLNGDWTDNGERFNVRSLFVGGGYIYRITDRAGIGATILFNVLPSTYNPYRNPIINAGFTYGL